MRSFKGLAFFLLLAVAAIAVPAFGQTTTTGDVVGVIKDTTGAVVPDATVAIKSLESGETRTEKSNSRGDYRFSLLKPGEYTVSASTAGLKSNISKISLLVGQAAELDITLNPKGTSQTVEVSTEAAVLQTENANLETSFSRKQVWICPWRGAT